MMNEVIRIATSKAGAKLYAQHRINVFDAIPKSCIRTNRPDVMNRIVAAWRFTGYPWLWPRDKRRRQGSLLTSPKLTRLFGELREVVKVS